MIVSDLDDEGDESGDGAEIARPRGTGGRFVRAGTKLDPARPDGHDADGHGEGPGPEGPPPSPTITVFATTRRPSPS